MNVPFSEYEKRFLLAEVIKASNVPLDTLLSIVKTEGVLANWEEVCLPPTRNLKACMAAFNELLSGPSTFSQHQSGFEPILPPPRKRRLSATDPTPSTARQIQPKPAPNGNQNPAFQFAPGSGPKKRGRPSKQEVLARQEAAAARGEVYPAPKTPARKSTGAVTPVASVSFEAGPASEPNLKIGDTIDTPTSAKKRRGRPSKADLEAQNLLHNVNQAPQDNSAVPGEAGGDTNVFQAPTTEETEARDAIDAMITAQEIPDSTTSTHTLMQQSGDLYSESS